MYFSHYNDPEWQQVKITNHTLISLDVNEERNQKLDEKRLSKVKRAASKPMRRSVHYQRF
jgi:hypothetical protein